MPFRNTSPLDEEGRCALCRAGASGFEAAYSFGSFEGGLRELIHLFKYGRVEALARPLGRYLRQALPRGERFDFIVPMPLHWTRAWRRGFNQAALLAAEVSRGTGIPVLHQVRRAHKTSPQAGLTRAGRRSNVRGAFAPARKALDLQGKRVLLVDDVMTTGATASACARAIKKTGALSVVLLTVARADRRDYFAVPAFPKRGLHLSHHLRSAEDA